jgi:hypothetical protein
MSILIIGPQEKDAIASAMKKARRRPTPLSVGRQIAQADTAKIDLRDRKGPVDLVHQEYPAQQVMLGTYRAAFSFEEQPIGIFRHLSISSARPGMVPGPDVLIMVCQEFGFSHTICGVFADGRRNPKNTAHPGRIWAEEFEPGHYAINVVELETIT